MPARLIASCIAMSSRTEASRILPSTASRTPRQNTSSECWPCAVHVKGIGWRSVMHAVVRNYSGKGTKALFDLLEKNKEEVESLIRVVKGFVSYSLVRTTRGGFSVSVYQDKAGADESTRVAREWIAKNASKTGVARPTI